VNCALLTWRTNRALSYKDPITYLKERADSCALGEDELKRMLTTHLIHSNNSQWLPGLSDEERRAKVPTDFETFCALEQPSWPRQCNGYARAGL
jgi:hypothetical protein